MQTSSLHANVHRFSGSNFASTYHSARPKIPLHIAKLLVQYTRSTNKPVVVDLGAGTGLSTVVWSSVASKVIGIEPNKDMRSVAESMAKDFPNVEFREGYSHDTKLKYESVDVVICSQSFHWMEPKSTLQEVARILRKGGVFAVIDYVFAPSIPTSWEAEVAYSEFMQSAKELGRLKNKIDKNVRRWDKSEHFNNVKNSGLFRYCRELKMHNEEVGCGQRLVNLALSQGEIETLRRNGLSEEELGIDKLRDRVFKAIGKDEKMVWIINYGVVLGIK